MSRVLPIAAVLLSSCCSTAWAADELRITRADCSRLVRHEPAPDVAYRPGVDARGKPVAPADLGGGAQLKLPDEIVIKLEFDVLRGRRSGLEGNTALGTITLRNGRAYVNDEPLHGWEQEVLLEACRKHGIR